MSTDIDSLIVLRGIDEDGDEGPYLCINDTSLPEDKLVFWFSDDVKDATMFEENRHNVEYGDEPTKYDVFAQYYYNSNEYGQALSIVFLDDGLLFDILKENIDTMSKL